MLQFDLRRASLVALASLGTAASAHADLLVASFHTFQILRYDELTGAYLGAFGELGPSARPLGMTIRGTELFVGMNDFGPPFQSYVLRFDALTGANHGRFAVGSEILGPHSLEFGPDGNLYVASFGGLAPFSKVARYDGTTGAYIDDFVPVGSGGLSGLEGLVFGPGGDLFLTSRQTNQVLRYDGTTGAFLGSFTVGGPLASPVDLAFGPNGNLFVVGGASGLRIFEYDGSTGAFVRVFTTTTQPVTDGSSLRFGPNGDLFVSTGHNGDSVVRIDGTTGALVNEFVASGAGGLDYSTDLIFLTPAPCGQVYCDSNPANSATITLNTCDLEAESMHVRMQGGAPGNVGYLLIGAATGTVTDPPGSLGDLCLAGGVIGRYTAAAGVIDASGTLSTDLLNAIAPGGGALPDPIGGNLLMPAGQTWSFQYWYRDGANPARFSQAITATFR